MPEIPEIPVPELLESHAARFGRVIAVAIVLTTLVGALCGYMQARALQRNDDALIRAQQWSALAARVSDNTQQGEQLLLARFRRAEAERLRSAQATGQRLWADLPVSVNSPARRLQQLAALTDADSRQLSQGMAAEFAAIDQQDNADLLDGAALRAGDGPSCPTPAWAQPAIHPVRSPPAVGDNALGEGPNQDPGFPNRYLADDRREGYRLDALRVGANIEAAAAEKQFTRYAVSLASLAVVVFLLGYSLTPQGRAHRKLYALVAGSILAGASLWGIYAAVREPATGSPQSAAAYADGRVAADRAETPADYSVAIRYFNCAIALKPDFALAYEWRAEAFFGSATNSFLLTSAVLNHALQDAQRARQLGANDPRLLNILAALLDAAGVSHHDRGQVAEVLRLVQAAHHRVPSDPVLAFNVADALLTLGRPSATAYTTAERLAALSQDTRGPSAELTALEFVAGSPFGPRLRASITAAKRSIVASLATGSAVAGLDAASVGVRADGAPSLSVSISDGSGGATVSPSQAEFFVDSGRGFDPRRDRLYAVWYHHSGSHWQVVPSISGPIQANNPSGLSRDSAGRMFSIKASTSQCLPSGPYRVELYVNGVPAGQATQTSYVSDLVNLRLPALLFGVCHPPGWQRTPARLPGLIDGYVSPTHDAGVLVLDASAGAPTDRPSGPVLDQALRVFHSLLPAGLGPRIRVRTEFAGGLCGQLVGQYSYPHGRLAAGIGRDGFNREIVGVVYGPTSSFGARPTPFSAGDLFSSMASDETCTH